MASSAFWNCILILVGCVSVINACITTNLLFRVRIVPANQTIPSFDNVTLTCRRATVTEVTSLLTTYSWHRVDGVIPTKAVGEHSEKLVIPSVVAADEGQYYCITEMFGHCAKSNSATVNVDGCPCDLSGSRNITCNQTAWQCECYPNITGRLCDTCAQEGYYGPTEDHECKRCSCVMENTEECISESGECKCKVGWTGDDCSVEEKCPEGATGDQCYTCIDGYYGDPKNNKPCQRCNCSNNNDGGSCDSVNGNCLKCLNNTIGQNCHICVNGYYGDAVNGACKPCGCHAKGAKGKKCDQKTGQCICKKRVTGKACDQCRDGTWGLRRNGCKQCKCNKDGTTDRVCDKRTGKCECLYGYSGKRCNQKEEIIAYKYSGSAYSSFLSNIAMATSAQLTVNARLESENGILYYFSQYGNGTGNYFLVQFLNGIIELSFSEGESVTTISGTKKLPVNKWIMVQIGIEQSTVSILVREESDITKQLVESIRKSISSNPVPSITTFYTGGIPPPPFTVLVKNTNFIGCLQKPLISLSSATDSVVAERGADVNTSLC